MTTEVMTEKAAENRLRRAATRQRLRLIKSRRRDPRASDYGTYMLVDAYTNVVEGYQLLLMDVADYLAQGEQQ
jgi:hypothetical protein